MCGILYEAEGGACCRYAFVSDNKYDVCLHSDAHYIYLFSPDEEMFGCRGFSRAHVATQH